MKYCTITTKCSQICNFFSQRCQWSINFLLIEGDCELEGRLDAWREHLVVIVYSWCPQAASGVRSLLERSSLWENSSFMSPIYFYRVNIAVRTSLHPSCWFYLDSLSFLVIIFTSIHCHHCSDDLEPIWRFLHLTPFNCPSCLLWAFQGLRVFGAHGSWDMSSH